MYGDKNLSMRKFAIVPVKHVYKNMRISVCNSFTSYFRVTKWLFEVKPSCHEPHTRSVN